MAKWFSVGAFRSFENVSDKAAQGIFAKRQPDIVANFFLKRGYVAFKWPSCRLQETDERPRSDALVRLPCTTGGGCRFFSCDPLIGFHHAGDPAVHDIIF